jgi:hypothetical protein
MIDVGDKWAKHRPVGAGLLAMAVHQTHRSVLIASKPAPTRQKNGRR